MPNPQIFKDLWIVIQISLKILELRTANFIFIALNGCPNMLIYTLLALIREVDILTAFAKHYPEVPFQVITRDNYWEFLAMDNQ